MISPMKSLSAEHIRFGKRLRELRKSQGLTQEGLAAKAGVDRSYIGFLERGEANPSLTLMLKFARIFKVNTEDLLKR